TFYMRENSLGSEEVLRVLLKFTGYYSKILNSKSNNKSIQNQLTIIVQLKSTSTYLYMISLCNKYYGEKEFTRHKFCIISRIINCYLNRRAIVNIPTNALNKVISNPRKEANKNTQTEEDSVAEYLISRTGSALFPRNRKLKESILNEDMYNRNHRLVK